MTPLHVRAARAMLGMSQQELAEASLLSWTSINSFERERGRLSARTRQAILSTLEERGIVFLAGDERGPGVRLRKQATGRPSSGSRLG